MTYAELSEAQARRSRQFAEAQTDVMSVYCDAERDLKELQAENAKLREQNRYLMKGDLLHVLTDQEYIDQCERERLMQVSIDALDKENAKLRELCVKALEWLRWAGGITCPPEVPDKFADELRELGIEVDA